MKVEARRWGTCTEYGGIEQTVPVPQEQLNSWGGTPVIVVTAKLGT